jgi:hypothetical protein
MEYLDRDHPVFRSDGERLARAEQATLRHALSSASRYRIEFDVDRLRALMGDEAFTRLFGEPGAIGRAAGDTTCTKVNWTTPVVRSCLRCSPLSGLGRANRL